MSRSYKKFPIVSDDGKHCKYNKRLANKKVRKSKCDSGGMFKKLFESWNIKDWKVWIDKKDKKSMSK